MVIFGLVLLGGLFYYYWCDWDNKKDNEKAHVYVLQEGASGGKGAQWSGNVEDVDAQGLQKFMQSHDVIVVAFVANGCGHCTTAKPAIHKAAKKSKKPVLTCHAHRPGIMKVCEQLGIMGFPTIMKLSKGKKVDEYRGDRSEASFAQYFNS
jgi:thioredoxin-like negative regulator of GroEL